MKAAEGSWKNKAPLSLSLFAGIFSHAPYIIGYLIWGEPLDPSVLMTRHLQPGLVWSQSRCSNNPQPSVAYSNKGVFLIHIMGPLRATTVMLYAIFLPAGSESPLSGA